MPEGDHKVVWNSENESGEIVKQGVYVVKFINLNTVNAKTIVKMR